MSWQKWALIIFCVILVVNALIVLAMWYQTGKDLRKERKRN